MNINEILESESECSHIEFKSEQYQLGKHQKKNELLKDIIALANHYLDIDKYIIIGVKELKNKTKQYYNIEFPIDDANYQQFITSSIEPKITFEYKLFQYDGKQLAYFKLYGNSNRPYLFGKDIKLPGTDTIEYRKGEGFIRVGTSTERMGRQELDKIYEAKIGLKDRKPDIKIFILLVPSTVSYLRSVNVIIENTSNRSITLDVDLKLLNGVNELISAFELQQESYDKGLSRYMPHSFGPPPMPNILVNFTRKSDHVYVSRNDTRGITIQQNSEYDDVFMEEVFVVADQYDQYNISGELIIRSDDFTGGALVKKFTLNITDD